MDYDATRSGVRRAPARASARAAAPRLRPKQTRDAVELLLYMDREKVEVRLDADGIHFHQPGGSTNGLLPWSSALAMSLMPAGVRPG